MAEAIKPNTFPNQTGDTLTDQPLKKSTGNEGLPLISLAQPENPVEKRSKIAGYIAKGAALSSGIMASISLVMTAKIGVILAIAAAALCLIIAISCAIYHQRHGGSYPIYLWVACLWALPIALTSGCFAFLINPSDASIFILLQEWHALSPYGLFVGSTLIAIISGMSILFTAYKNRDAASKNLENITIKNLENITIDDYISHYANIHQNSLGSYKSPLKLALETAVLNEHLNESNSNQSTFIEKMEPYDCENLSRFLKDAYDDITRYCNENPTTLPATGINHNNFKTLHNIIYKSSGQASGFTFASMTSYLLPNSHRKKDTSDNTNAASTNNTDATFADNWTKIKGNNISTDQATVLYQIRKPLLVLLTVNHPSNPDGYSSVVIKAIHQMQETLNKLSTNKKVTSSKTTGD